MLSYLLIALAHSGRVGSSTVPILNHNQERTPSKSLTLYLEVGAEAAGEELQLLSLLCTFSVFSSCGACNVFLLSAVGTKKQRSMKPPGNPNQGRQATGRSL